MTFKVPRSAMILLSLLPLGSVALGQALPTAEAAPISTGFELPRAEGTLSYSVGVNESISSGYYASGLGELTGLNGNLAYISPSKVDPFSMVFSGGRLWSNSAGQQSTTFLNLGLSQVLSTRKWNFVVSDSVNYLPQTPSTGLSGIPGVGDLGIAPVQIGLDSGQGVLTGFSTRIYNVATVSAQRQITGKTAIQASGGYTTQDFLGDSGGGLDSSGESLSFGLSHRIDGRSTVGLNYGYSRFGYGSSQPSIVSQTGTFQYSRELSRRLNFSVSAGPQHTSSATFAVGTLVETEPAATNLFASAGLNYATQTTSSSLSYSRGANSGFGVVQGSRSDNLNFRIARTFAKAWNLSATSAYTRSSSLGQVQGKTAFSATTYIEGVQVSRALARSLSAYASYTLERQATPNNTIGINVFSGYFQTASFGLTYSPTALHFGPR